MEHGLKVGDKIFVDIKRVGINGEGIAFYKKLAIFVDNALPKENILVELTDVKRKYAYGKIAELKVASKSRVNPVCPYYSKCGGCSLQHLKYEDSKDIKKGILLEALNRYSGVNPRQFEIRDISLMDNPYGYRHKATLPLRQGEHGVVWGLYGANSEKFVRIKECMVHSPIINEIANKVCTVLDSLNISAYDLKNKKGYAKYLIIRSSHVNDDTQVTFIFDNVPNKLEELGKACLDINHVKSVYYSINKEEDSTEFFGDKVVKIAGSEYITEELNGYSYNLYPNSFFQLNPLQAEVLYNKVKKVAKFTKNDKVIDAYCGVGAIALNIANSVGEVIGVENNKDAIKNAIDNQSINKISNAKFIEGDVNNLISYLTKEKNNVSTIVLDPPRSGLDDKTIDVLRKSNINKIIYVSCNPSTLAKNISQLCDKYNVNLIEMVDMFPLTSHVESICYLVKK